MSSPFGNTGPSYVPSSTSPMISSSYVSSAFGNTEGSPQVVSSSSNAGASGVSTSAGPSTSSSSLAVQSRPLAPWGGFGSPEAKPIQSTAVINKPVYGSPAVVPDQDTAMSEVTDKLSNLSVKHNEKDVQALLDDVVEIHSRLKRDVETSIHFANSLKSVVEGNIVEKQNQMALVENLLDKVAQILGHDIGDVRHKKSRLSAAAGGNDGPVAASDDANLEFLLFQQNVMTKQYISSWFIGPSSVAERRFFLKFLYNRLKNGYH
eukprot:768645-Hanusia_phi.AAC.1